MTTYLSGCTNPLTVAAAITQRRLGILAQPGNSIHLQHHHYSSWGIDNGAFGKARRGTPWTDADSGAFLRYLGRVANEVDISRVLFAVAPDVLEFRGGVPIGDAQKTWARSQPLFAEIRALGFPAALVAQDGINAMAIDYDAFDVLFLGGSDQFKLGMAGRIAAGRARRAGKRVHMGRVNSYKRFAYASRIGCDSADGTYLGYGPAINLPKLLSWLDRTEPAPVAVAA